MGAGYNRKDLRSHAKAKLDDALLLLHNKRYSNSYYLAGYAVEIGLKACVAAQVTSETIPEKAFLQKFYNHDFDTLVGLAGLAQDRKSMEKTDQDFATNWAIVSEWSPDIRYEAVDPTSAETMLSAIIDPKSGVLKWIKAYW